MGSALHGVAHRDVKQGPHQPDRVGVAAGAGHLALVVRQGDVRIALIQSNVGEYVGGIRDAPGAPAGNTALREGRQRSRARKLTAIPRAPRGHTDGRGEQRVVAVRVVDDALRPASRLIADAQVRKLGQRRDQPKCEVDVLVRRCTLERRAQVVVVGQHPLDPGPLVGTMHRGGGALGELGVVLRVPRRVPIVNPVLPQAITAECTQRFQNAVPGPVGAAAHDDHRLVDEPGE